MGKITLTPLLYRDGKCAVNFPLINPKKFGPLDNHRTVERRGADNRLMQ